MSVLGGILMFIGVIVAFVGGIMFLIVAFKQNILWGLGCIFVPFVSLIFLIMYWNDAKKPFLIQLTALPFYILGIVLLGMAGGQVPN